MSNNPAKDFDTIADDYVFFETHATEPENDARAYASQLKDFASSRSTINMLDFGCGSGNFTTRLLKLLNWPAERLELTLVEPADEVRKLAVERLTKFTDKPIADSAALPTGLAGKFDLVLANHVFYYVPDLKGHFRKLIDTLNPSGMFLTAIAGRSNLLIEFWLQGFALLGKEVPYHVSEDVDAALRAIGANYQKEVVPYELTFPDTKENRMKIIRFLLADHLAAMPLEPLMAIFDKHSRGGKIAMRTASDHYRVLP
jgi:trans-aconitate 2-methyltransferase